MSDESSACWTPSSAGPGAMQALLLASRRPTFFPSCKLERVDRHALLADTHARALAAHLAVAPPLSWPWNPCIPVSGVASAAAGVSMADSPSEGAQALADLAAPKAALAALRDEVRSSALEAACRSALAEQPGAPPPA